MCHTCRHVRPLREEFLNHYSHFLQGLHSLDLLGEAVEHGLAAAQQVGLQNHSHSLAEVRTPCHLTADVPEEEVADSLALQSKSVFSELRFLPLSDVMIKLI